MERERSLHYVALLLGLLAWAAAADAQQAACDASTLSSKIVRFCTAPDMDPAECCKTVVASVELGVPCVCLIAADPMVVLSRLNASYFLSSYTRCGGVRSRVAEFGSGCSDPASRSSEEDLEVPIVAPPPMPRGKHHRPPRLAPRHQQVASLLLRGPRSPAPARDTLSQ